jgi:amino acid transporter
MELAGVHVTDIENPKKNFPKAIGLSVLILLGTLIFGALAVAVVIPKEDIRFVDGVMQTFTTFFTAFNIPFLVPVLAFLIMLGSIGGSVNWLLSPAKGLLQAAEQGFLPSYFAQKNKHGVTVRILIVQAILVSIFCCAIQLVPSINSFYWFLMALSTGLYIMMYILLFLAALTLRRTENSYQIPFGMRTHSCLAGLAGCVITIIVGFQPAPDVVIQSKLQYAMIIGLGFVVLVAPVFLLWAYHNRRAVSLRDC